MIWWESLGEVTTDWSGFVNLCHRRMLTLAVQSVGSHVMAQVAVGLTFSLIMKRASNLVRALVVGSALVFTVIGASLFFSLLLNPLLVAAVALVFTALIAYNQG